MKIKICGLRRACDIEYVNELLPDYIGFIFAEKSRRYVPPAEAAKLKEQLDPRIKAVGVFVDAPMDKIVTVVEQRIIDAVQLHGSEDDGYIRKLQGRADCPILKAFIVRGVGDVRAAEQSPADYVLLDGGEGSGRPFDWSQIKNITRPYFLAGGLNLDNLQEAIQELGPYAVDVSSGVETGGWKDYAKIKRFMEICSEQQGRRGKQ